MVSNTRTLSLRRMYSQFTAIHSDSGWVWAMLAARGLNWKNVFDVYDSGVSEAGGCARAVPGPHAFLLLPDRPTTALEWFQQVPALGRMYPEVDKADSRILNRTLFEHKLLSAGLQLTPCTWRDAQTILDNIRNEDDDSDAMELWTTVYMTLPEEMQHTVLAHAVASEHPWIATPWFVEQCTQDIPLRTRAWNALRSKTWANPELVSPLLDKIPWSDTLEGALSPLDVLALLQKNPDLIDLHVPSILHKGVQCVQPDFYFEEAMAMLAQPRHKLMLHINFNREPSWDLLRDVALETEHLALPTTLLAYQTLSEGQRKLQECGEVLRALFKRNSLSFDNDFCVDLMSAIVGDEPDGVMAQYLALGALVYSSDTQSRWSSAQSKGCWRIFHCDPKNKVGFQGLLDRLIPEMRGFLQAAEGLGLSLHATWLQGMELMHAMGHGPTTQRLDATDVVLASHFDV